MDMNKLEEAYNAASRAFSESQTEIKSIEARIAELKELQTQVRAYAQTRKTREQYAELRTDKQRQRFREEHQSDFILMNAARKYFREHGYDPIPKAKEIKTELDQLYAEENIKYEEYKERREVYQKLSMLRQNIRQVMGETERDRKKETPTKS